LANLPNDPKEEVNQPGYREVYGYGNSQHACIFGWSCVRREMPSHPSPHEASPGVSNSIPISLIGSSKLPPRKSIVAPVNWIAMTQLQKINLKRFVILLLSPIPQTRD
jgi:hypothetical protein